MRQTRRSARAAVLLTALTLGVAVLPLGPAAAQADEVTIERYAGENRYATARLIAEDTFTEVERVLIAKAEDWPDALAGGYLAGLLGSPVLLVSRDGVQAATLQALESLEADAVTLLGGPGAISAASSEALQDAGYDVDRVFGPTRYETSVAVALHGDENDVGLWDGQRTAIVATGEQYADALVASAVAFSEAFPVLLTPSAQLHPAVAGALVDLDIERVILPGGAAAVSPAVEDEIEDLGIEVRRVRQEGGGRWETALAFADFATTEFGYTRAHIDLATGLGFADALVMGPHAGTGKAPLLLTPGTEPSLPGSLDDWLRLHSCEIESAHIAGGAAVVSPANADATKAAAEDCEERSEVRIDETNVTPGQVVQALFTVPDETALRAISVAGPCVLSGDIWNSDTSGVAAAADDILASFAVHADADPGSCRVQFTLHHFDGTSIELTRVLMVRET